MMISCVLPLLFVNCEHVKRKEGLKLDKVVKIHAEINHNDRAHYLLFK